MKKEHRPLNQVLGNFGLEMKILAKTTLNLKKNLQRSHGTDKLSKDRH